MKNNDAKRLVEHISDQYVSLASDPVSAFEAIRERKTRGRARLWTVTATAAAVFIFTVIFLLSGAMNSLDPPVPPSDQTYNPGSQPGQEEPNDPGKPPENPDEPGIENPGTDTPSNPEQIYKEPEITVPDRDIFSCYMSGFWTSNRQDGSGNIPYLFNFQHSGQVYILNLDTKEANIGRYSFSDNQIELFTRTEDGRWEQSDITMQLNRAGINFETNMTVTDGKYTETYQRIQLSFNYLKVCNLDVTPQEIVSIEAFFIEEMTLLESYDSETVSFELPSLEYVKTLEVHQFNSAPTALRITSLLGAQYRIYDEDLELICEGECATASTSEFSEIKFPEENGLYYLEVIVNDSPNELFESLVLHFYAAIQAGEPEEPSPTEPSFPENSNMSNLCTVWYLDIEDSSTHGPSYFIFTPTRQFYMINTKTGESVQGVYTSAAHPEGQYRTNVTAWILDEEGTWQEYPFEIQMKGSGQGLENYKLHVTGEDGKTSYSRTKVNVVDFLAGGRNAYGIFDRHANSSSYAPKYYIESINVTLYNDDPHKHFEFNFDYDDTEIFNGMTPIPIGAGTYTIRPDDLGNIASYTIYRADGTIYEQAEFDFSRQDSYSLNGIPLIPDGQVYYYHIRYLKSSLYSDGLQYVMHAYFAVQQSEKKVIPAYTPPQTPPDPELILPDASYYQSYLGDVWYPSALDGYREVKIPLWFAFQPDGRVYIWNTKTNLSTIGRYSVTDDRVDVYSCQDGIRWTKENNIDIQVDTANKKLIVSYGKYTDTFKRLSSTHHHVTVLNNDTRTEEKAYISNFYFEEFSYNGMTYRFELPRFEIF